MLIIDGIAIEATGRLDDVCPTCGAVLARRPGKKTPCGACGEPIMVRTRPLDGRRVLASSKDAALIERQWLAFMNLKRVIYWMASDHPELQPLFDDLHRGRRGETPVDFDELERYAMFAGMGPYLKVYPEQI